MSDAASPTPATAALPAPDAAALRSAERWAEAVKAQSIYPAGHHRVRAALDALRAALDEAFRLTRGPEAGVRFIFTDGSLLVGETRVPVDPDGPLAWLRERFDHAALAGLELKPGVTREHLEALGRRLLDVQATKDLDRDPRVLFAPGWPRLTLLDRRFEGVCDGSADPDDGPQRTWAGLGPPLAAAERASLASALHQDPGIRARLAAIRQRVGGTPGSPGLANEDELLQRVAGALPGAVARDRGRVRAVAGGLLDALEQRLDAKEAGGGLRAFFEDPALGRRVAFLYSSLFRAQDRAETPARAAASDGSRPVGHRPDDRVDDDLAAFLLEFGNLPAFEAGADAALELESRSEQLGVLLHLRLRHTDPDELRGLDHALRAAIAGAGAAEAEILRRVLASLAQRADEGGEAVGVRVVVDLLRTADRLDLLRQAGYLGPERAAECFPEDFCLYLDALDVSAARDRTELVEVLRTVGDERLRAAAPQLVTPEGLLEPRRLERLLAYGDAGVEPLADLLWVHGSPEVRKTILGWLRRLPGTPAATGLLPLVEDVQGLPPSFVRLVLDRLLARTVSDDGDALVTDLLVRFVRTTAGRVDRRARRIQAVRLLGTCRRAEARAVLEQVAHARRWWLFPVEDRMVREAAREALRVRRSA